MADIRPFRAIRPAKGKEEIIASLPYDVFNRKEAYEKVKRNPESFLAIDRPETQFPEDHDMYAKEVYEKAHDMLWERVEKGDFVKDEGKFFYIYEQTFKGRTQTGIVACASIDDYLSNVIKKHENTRADKEEDRIKHVYTCNAQTGPIFLCYRKNKLLSELVARVKELDEPVYDFVSEDGVANRIFIISDEDEINTISRVFTTIKSVYIADGHHRCASAVKVGLKKREEREKEGKLRGKLKSDYFLSVLFPDDELEIMDYNRVVKDLNGLTADEFMAKISEKFEVSKEETSVKPSKKGEFGMLLDGNWYRLNAQESILKDDAVEGLDVSVLQNEVLGPILGIGDPKTDKRIDFVGGIRGLSELEKRCGTDMKVAFSMYPTSLSELFEVADQEKLMPPKSTWFEPKLLSGLFIHDINGIID
ncbi:Uncharacterized conserved protein, DUF1015 family [Butyrivibrio hungatei DSM 14810]|uniref:Uncharacterized conserved protein, DUF1015 family n=1 Tax=Butyrivibrio hungatei DSM 14810 TaxID=1121132 RepID=A0A1M7T5I5_9FIRM|nr:DUF1015 family protein [Butyrivibrio hungatei]SHN65981.1 Uncharacterized conserved protein, DUF1015 family [Butyrivibrio hungatei DSM 14810]